MAIFSNEFLHRVSAGKVQGASIVHKFGQSDINSNFRPVTDDNNYRTPTAPVTLEVFANSAQDTSGGSGAHTVMVEGLGVDFRPQQELVIMAGGTRVPLVNQYMRVFRMYVVSCGVYSGHSATSHNGIIWLRDQATNQTWATIRNYEGIGMGSTLIGAYTVPKGFNAHILRAKLITENSRTVDVTLLTREGADVVTPSYTALKASSLFRTISNNTDLQPVGLGKELRGPCDIMYVARLADGGLPNAVRLSVEFDILLLDQC